MVSIPSQDFNVGWDEFAVPFEEGIGRIADTVGEANLHNVVNGMLFRIGAVDLPGAVDPERQLHLHVKSQVLLEIRSIIVMNMRREE